MKILHQYIMRQAVVTLGMTLGVFTFVLLMMQVLKKLTDLLVNRQLGLEPVATVVALMMPNVLGFTLPMAMLATCLLVCGRLSADHEITALRASGLGLGEIVTPLVLLATLAAALGWTMHAVAVPWSRMEIRRAIARWGSERPLTLLQEGAHIRDFPGYVLYVGRKNENILEDVTVYVLDKSGNVASSLWAEKAVVKPQPETRKILLEMHNVRGDVRDPKDPTNVRKIRPGLTAQLYPVELDMNGLLRADRPVRELSTLFFSDLLDTLQLLRARGIYPAAELVEAHQRVAAAVACLTFAMIGIPLGIRTGRRETSVGIALSLALAVVYYLFSVLANALKMKPHLYPEAILWIPNFLFVLLGLWLLGRARRA